MRFTELSLSGAFLVEVDKLEDDRGFFGRAWCSREFEAEGLTSTFVQANVGYSRARGTLRGLHFQRAPFEEAKLVRCTRGVVFDVIVDLRPQSTTLHRWEGVELDADGHAMVYVPEGCAHGYLTLSDGAEVFYQTSQFYAPEAVAGARFDDPALAIDWPIEVTTVSEQDRNWPLLELSGEWSRVREPSG